jgi:hypothetical protein
VVANLYRADLPGAGIGDGYHAFSIPIPPDLVNGQGYYISAVFGNYNPALSENPTKRPFHAAFGTV